MLYDKDRPRVALPLPRNVPKAARQKVEEAIEAMIAWLDHMDGDADHEDVGDDEPSLGGGELGDDRELDDCDDEPSLAHTNDFNQVQAQRLLKGCVGRDGTWFHANNDSEAQHDGREPDVDDEPRCPPNLSPVF
jgi:hypothetical protein